MGLQWLDAFALGHDLTLYGTIADDPETLYQLSAYWRIPLPWRHELRINGYYAESHSTTELLGIPFDETGISWETSVRYVVPWRLNDRWRSEWWVGYDYKQFNNEFVFGGSSSSPFLPAWVPSSSARSWSYDTERDHARFSLEAAHGGEGWAEGQDSPRLQ